MSVHAGAVPSVVYVRSRRSCTISRVCTFTQELYHQSCMNACVMFAAIPDFKANETFSAASVTGSECLRLLNEIVSAFDMVTKLMLIRDNTYIANCIARESSTITGGVLIAKVPF